MTTASPLTLRLIGLVEARFAGATDEALGRSVGMSPGDMRNTFSMFGRALETYLSLYGRRVDPVAGRDMVIHSSTAGHVLRRALAGDPIADLDAELGERGSAAKVISAIIVKLHDDQSAHVAPIAADLMAHRGIFH